MTTPNTSFDVRGNQDIQFSGSTPRGNEIPVGCFVTLRSGNVKITCRVVSCDSQQFCGVVESFENWTEPTWNGWSVGDEITFCEENVFWCNTTAIAA